MREIPGAWRRTAQGAGLLDAADSPAPTIFAEMTALATRTGAINLGQGFPDEDGPAEVLEAALAAIAAGANQYAPGRGVPALLHAVAAHQHHWYGLEVSPDTDVLVMILPHSDATSAALNADRLARLRQGALLVNVARGRVVDTDALVDAVASGHVRAALDVTDPEPLPPGHPLWAHPRVRLTPHIASMTQPASAAGVVLDNLRRFERGEPMTGLVDRSAARRRRELWAEATD